jgi:hypothetical protein
MAAAIPEKLYIDGDTSGILGLGEAEYRSVEGART